MKTFKLKSVPVELKTSGEGALMIFEGFMIQIICPNKINIQNEPNIIKLIDEYVMENKEKYKEFALYQFSSYANATINVETVETEDEEGEEPTPDQIINIFDGKRKGTMKEENKEDSLKKIADELERLIFDNSKELPEYKERKFIFKRELVLKDENVINSPMGKRMMKNPIFVQLDGKEVNTVREIDFMGVKRTVAFIKDTPLEMNWCEEIK